MTKRQIEEQRDPGCVECQEGRKGHFCGTCARQVAHGVQQCPWCITAGKPEPTWQQRGGR